MAKSPRIDLRPGVTEPVVLMISRREVEAKDLASVVSRLKVFLATREDAWRYRGQMTLVVDGYNHDPRELVDIPEVRALLRGLEAEWPYWAYFFNQVDDSIKLLLFCVAGSRFLGRGAVEMDADGSHQPEQLPSLLRAAENADLVIGARWIKGGSVVNWPIHRKVLSVGANIYTKVMLGLPVNDATGGYRVYRTSALQTMDLDSVSSAGYGFQVDMTVALVRAGLVAVEVPIEFVEREIGESKMSGNIVSEAFVNVGKQGLAHRAGQLRGAAARLRSPREGRWHSA